MSAPRFRALLALLPVLLALTWAGAPTPLMASTASTAPTAPTASTASADTLRLRDLTAVLDTGVVLQDRNRDALVDFLDVRIVVPEDPHPEEAAAAADVAARFGFETSGTDMGLVVPPGELPLAPAGPGGSGDAVSTPVVVVGHRTGIPERAGIPTTALRDGLAPGEGALVLLPPSPRLPRGGVAVAGYDATGLLAASAYLSARYPAVWDPEGAAWAAVADRVRAWAAPRDGDTAAVRVERVVVSAGSPGIARAEVRLPAADAAAFERMVEGLLRTGASDSVPANEEEGDRSTLLVRDLHRLDVRVEGPDSSRTVAVRPEEPWRTADGSPWSPGPDPSFSLSALYDVGGLFRDTDQDLVPDETSAFLSFTAATPGSALEVARAAGDLAVRIGLETAGARLPLGAVDAQEDDPAARGFPVLVGAEHYQLRRLLDGGELPGWDPAPLEGSVHFVDGALQGRSALVVAGGDDAGTAAALDWTARRAPYLWTYGKGEYRLADAETEVRRFFQVVEAPGQAALALHKLRTWAERMAGAGPAERVEVELATRESPEGLAEVARAAVAERLPGARVDVRTWATGFGVGDTVYHRTFDFEWEVDEVRGLLEREVYPAVRQGAPARVHVRVSEPPEVREALEGEIRAALEERGASPAGVTVLSAYKQGYSWLHDVVLPRLLELEAAGRTVERIRVGYHTLEESEEVRWQTIAADTRWLQEIYPVDVILGRELGIPDSAITFHATRRPEPVYTVAALDPSGDTLLAETFDPTYVVRPFFDRFPEYERVRVTTGWLRATVGGAGGAPDTLVDRRVVTDPERFWDALQDDVYGRIVDYVMDIQEGDPSPGNAPFFDEFTVRLRMSEPNHRIGVDEEVISSLEALHEDIYFETLTLFDLIGNRYGVGGLSYPGRVLPYIDPTGTGEPGSATVILTGKERGVPELVVRSWHDPRAGEPVLRRYPLSGLPVDDPSLRGVTVRQGEEGLARLLFAVEARDSVDRWEEYRERGSEPAIDRTFLSAELLEGMVEGLRTLHDAGLFRDRVAWDRVEETAFLLSVEDDSTWRRVVALPRSGAPHSTDNPTLAALRPAGGAAPPADRLDPTALVQWRRPIPPAESDSILARLDAYPGVRGYYLTRSFLGQPVWAADFLPPQPSAYVSQAKLNALKPTLFISGRQHANEVSSTSHILRLGALLVADSAHRSMLDRVNVVLHPVTNPDGARLAVEMQETNPDFMLHAGYLGALGVDAAAGERSDDPVYPESQARRMIRETWLPDVYMNMHGYPSHEWVQYFAGYSAWVRSRRGGARDWWAPRGWFVPGFSWVDDEENPEYREAQFALLDSMTSAVRALPGVAAMSDRMYARYRKYGREDRDDFREHFRNGVLVYEALRGAESVGQGVYSPRITWYALTTEAPDETARGEWLELVASAGLAHAVALLEYLAEGEYEVKREAEGWSGAVVRKVFRVKPVLPPEEDAGEPPA